MISPLNSTTNLFIDIRAELKDLFNGSPTSIGFAFEVIVRHVNKTQRCPCWDHVKKEADASCERCLGKGWLVYDKVYRAIKRKYIGKEELDAPGLYEIDSTLFFFEYTVSLSESDTIIEVETDDSGKILPKVKYLKKHSIKDVEPLRGNNGRVEFIKVFASKAE